MFENPIIKEKLEILTGAAKYDVSCASSGSDRSTPEKGIGNTSTGGICHSWSADGRCISLLKILMSNQCIYDCAYCVNRRSNDIPRAAFTPEEVVDLTINFYRRNYIEGLFLSSGVDKSVDDTMDRMIRIAKKLRDEKSFGGYIHLKIVPGAAQELVRQAGLYADRVSVNVELPSADSLHKLAPQKKKQGIFQPMARIGEECMEYAIARRKSQKPPAFAPAGQSTQMIIGASPEPDYMILNLSEALYNKYQLKRVYYSAFVPVNEDEMLPALPEPPMLREHRLYQADFLMRQYEFKAGELLGPQSPNLDLNLDPKADWALRNFDLFPIDINRSPYELLLRVPGLGVRSAKRIIATRRVAAIRPEDLKRIGLVMKRAKYFLSINGIPLASSRTPLDYVYQAMESGNAPKQKHEQLWLPFSTNNST
jgi:putative DNA modification/repair radical SAM protein